MSIVFSTTLGRITVDLYTDVCPLFSSSVLKLCKLRYYDKHLFFNVVKQRFAQTGDPKADGSGGMCVHGLIHNDDSHRFLKDEKEAVLKTEESRMEVRHDTTT